MRSQRRRDTKPELALRRELHRLGLRYRLDRQVVPGVRRRADVVFVGARVAVFVDGCFWHCCPVHGTRPKANDEWWAAKLERNVMRDRDTDQRLASAAWSVVRLWEHGDMRRAAEHINALLQKPLP